MSDDSRQDIPADRDGHAPGFNRCADPAASLPGTATSMTADGFATEASPLPVLAERASALLATLPRYTPGMRPVTDWDGAGPVVRLASNEMAFEPLPGVLEALQSPEAIIRYPDNTATAVRERIAQHLGVDKPWVTVGNGSVGIVRQMVDLVVGDGDEILMGAPSFDAYASVAHIAGARTVRVPLSVASLDLGAMLRKVGDRTRIVFVCTPNNPTGGVVTHKALTQFLKALPDHVLAVIDEAYFEFVDDPEAADGVRFAREYENVICLRTFSKAYGLAGLRLGYCVAHPSLIEALLAVQPAFAVNAVAQRAAAVSLDQNEHMADRVTAVRAERARLREQLVDLGIPVPPSQGNFLWLPVGTLAATLVSELATAGILVRAYGDVGVRVTIGTPEENDLFLAVLTRLIDRRRAHGAPEITLEAEHRA